MAFEDVLNLLTGRKKKEVEPPQVSFGSNTVSVTYGDSTCTYFTGTSTSATQQPGGVYLGNATNFVTNGTFTMHPKQYASFISTSEKKKELKEMSLQEIVDSEVERLR